MAFSYILIYLFVPGKKVFFYLFIRDKENIYIYAKAQNMHAGKKNAWIFISKTNKNSNYKYSNFYYILII